ncbi:MAG TPA: glycosyltransferase family 4 protein, partial [Candidatus Nitrosopolaris sp.]|nr:glycosyltransferase family 4 protein [Candidatus Nitrosopolaris sp.]
MVKSAEKLSVGFLFDDTLDSSDGVAQYVKTLGAWLSSQGHQVCYLVGETKIKSWADGRVYSLAKNQRVVFNGNRLSIPLPARRDRIKQVLRENKFDVLHVQVPYSPFMAKKVIDAADASTAVVGTFHILPANGLARAGSRALRLLYGKSQRRFDAMLSVSAPAAEFARRVYGIRSQVLPNVVDINRFQKTQERRSGKPTIVFLGRLVERKGCRQLLKAFKQLNSRLPGARLIIAGDGPQRRSLENYVRRNGLCQQVKFLGFIDEEAKPGLLAGADIACFPSLYGEAFGIVLIEAMAAGSGVVLGGDNSGYRSVLGDQPQLLIDPNDTEVFARRLESLLSDRARIEGLHSWQQAEVRQYDINAVGKRLVDIYR